MTELPYSNNSEMSVLGSLIEDCELIGKVEFLKPSDFYIAEHRELFKLITSEHSKGHQVDVQLMMELVNPKTGGLDYLISIVKNNYTTSHAIFHARRIVDMAVRRETIQSYQSAVSALTSRESKYMDEITKVDETVHHGLSRLAIGDVLTVEELISKSVDEMEVSMSNARLGISTGISEIDERLGYQQLAIGEVTYLGAQSKNGKTLFGNTIAARCDLLADETCHIFSIEMPALGMFNGVVSAMSGVPSNFYARQSYYAQMVAHKYDEWMGRWGAAANSLNESGKITIDDKKDVTMKYICAEMKKQSQVALNKGKRLRLVIIDHLHRISFDTSSKQMTYAMGDDVRMLKNTASELGIAVLLLGQLNESCKDRNPTAFDILDTARVRHEIQCFIGTRIFREDGGTFFGIYSDAHRYADHETRFDPAYVRLAAGVVKSLDESQKHWKPKEKQ